MSQETLTVKSCRECRKPIQVAEYTPHPLERDATGMPAERWDSDRERFRFVGWVCNECAIERAMAADGGGSISFPSLTFAYG